MAVTDFHSASGKQQLGGDVNGIKYMGSIIDVNVFEEI